MGIIVKLRQFCLTETLPVLYNTLILHIYSTALLFRSLLTLLTYYHFFASSSRAHSYPLFTTLQIRDIVVRLVLRKVSGLHTLAL